MASETVKPALDSAKVAEGLGELKEGNGYDRVVVDGKTVAYIKKGRVAAHAAHLAKLPKKLGSPEPEKSGPWANVAVETTARARAILEHVLAQRAAQAEKKAEPATTKAPAKKKDKTDTTAPADAGAEGSE